MSHSTGKPAKWGCLPFNVMSKMGIIRHTAKDRAKAVFFSKLIIITALVPIFSFQKVEGKMFSPLAYTLGFACWGLDLYPDTCAGPLVDVVEEECEGEA